MLVLFEKKKTHTARPVAFLCFFFLQESPHPNSIPLVHQTGIDRSTVCTRCGGCDLNWHLPETPHLSPGHFPFQISRLFPSLSQNPGQAIPDNAHVLSQGQLLAPFTINA